MNKIIILLLSTTFLFSCSKHEVNSSSSGLSEIIELSEIKIDAEAGVIPPTGLDFGSIEKGQIVQQEIVINSKNVSLVISEEDIDSSTLSPFSIVSNTCIGTILKNRTCKIVLKLDNTVSLAQSVQIEQQLVVKESIFTASF